MRAVQLFRPAFLLAALAFALAAALPARAQTHRIMGTVNGEGISEMELAQRVQFAMAASRIPDAGDNRRRVTQQMLRQIIDEKLQIQESKRAGIAVSDAEIQDRLRLIEQSNGMAPGQFEQAVRAAGVDPAVVRDQIRASIAWIKLIRRRVVPTVDVSEAEIDEQLRQIRATVGRPETRVAEIFFAVDRPEQAEEVRRNAERVAGQLRQGVPFAALAQQFSQGATASAGGDLGYVLPGALDAALDAAVQRLQPRQFSEPVRSAAGWHILLVVDRRQAGGQARPEEIRINIVQLLLPLPNNATAEEAQRQSGLAQSVMGEVQKCDDLFRQAGKLKGATVNEAKSIRMGDLPPNVREQLQNHPLGKAAGPYRVNEALQVVSICSREGTDGLPPRDTIGQGLRQQKIETAARRYMRDLRRNALVDIKS